MSFHDLGNIEKKIHKNVETAKAQTNEYTHHVEQFYAQVKQWVNPLVQNNKVKLNQVQETLKDSESELYHLNALEFIAGKHTAFLTPKGIVGEGSKQQELMVLRGATDNPSYKFIVSKAGCSWESSANKIEPLTEAKFGELLQKIIQIK